VDAITVRNLSKRFRYVGIPKETTFKESIVRLQMFRRPEKRYVRAIDDVSFSVPQGTMLGVIGRNGSGKTTLMRLLAGAYRQNAGTIKLAGQATLLSLGVGFHPDFSGRENIKISGLILGLSPREIASRFAEIVEFSELGEFVDAPVRTYSAGMYLRLAFSIAISVDPDILLLDEVLAVGDEAFAAKCFARIQQFKRRGKTIVLVTHDAQTIVTWCDSALWLEHGKARMFGAPSEVVPAYHAALAGYGQEPLLVDSREEGDPSPPG
jgi:ABC-type polysaccharide/polyol phosphate transport system ATPase subunit